MLRRENIRYHTAWVRLLCCFSWAMIVINAAHFNILSALDIMLVDLMTDGVGRFSLPIHTHVEPSAVLAFCLVAAIPRFDRPLFMILYGAGLMFLHLLGTSLVYLRTDVLLPLASPALGIVGSTLILQTMAWSEERLRRTRIERLVQARVQFTDMLVHDLKKRLSSILTSISLLEREPPAAGQDRDLLTSMRASSARMLLEINNLLDIRKIEERGMALHRQPVGISPLLRETVAEHQSAARMAGVSFRLHDDCPIEILADRHILSRIMTNLIWNAIQHAPPETTIELGAKIEDGMAVIFVANHGDPIPLFKQDTLFRPFFSGGTEDATAVDGTGLGLAFCKLAVEAHGGQILVESPRPDATDGVRILLRFPASASAA